MKHYTKKIVFISIPNIYIEAENLRCKWDENAFCAVASGTDKNSMIIDISDNLISMHIRKGMFLKSVRHIKGINVITVDYEYIKEINDAVMGYLGKYSIIAESKRFGEFYIDLTGTEKLFGRTIDTCLKILADINSIYGFHAKIGIGSNKLISYIASGISGANAVYEICADAEMIFLPHAKISDLPDVPPEVKSEISSSYNIQRVRELALFSRDDLAALFRKNGDILYSYSRNIAPDFLTASGKEKMIGGTAVLSDAANDDGLIRRRFFHLVLELCFCMRRENLFPLYFDLEVTYRDDYSFAKKKKIDAPTFIDRRVYGMLLPHLESALSRRTCIKKITLSFSKFIPAAIQESLFLNDDKDLKLCRAFDEIRGKYGKKSIYFPG